MNKPTSRIADLTIEERIQLEEKLLKKRSVARAKTNQTIARRGDSAPAPLSFAQQRLWFLHRMEPDNPQYNIPRAFRIRGALDLESLHKAIGAVLKRHESQRTLILDGEVQPLQQIAEIPSTYLSIVDLKANSQTGAYSKAKSILLREARRSFDISRDLPSRFTLLLLGQEDHILIIVQHHIASDGWSLGILSEEISNFYKSFCTGEAVDLPDLPIQYADFAVWQRQWLQGPMLAEQLAYWKQQLADSPALLQLPTDRPRPAVQSFNGSTESFLVPRNLLASLNKLSRQENCTLFMTLFATFSTLLYRYTGQRDIVVGSPIAGRNRTEIENLIGFFVNTLALRSDLSGNPSFRQLLGRIRDVCLRAYSNQDFPFEKIVEELQPERNLSYTPLFQVMFVLQNAPDFPLELSGLQVTPIEVHSKTSKFDLTLFLMVNPEGLHGTIEYNTDLFDASTIRRLTGHFQTLLQGIVEDPDQTIHKLPLLTGSERHQILVEWNNTQTDYPRDRCVHQLFEEQAEKTPETMALVFQDQSLTYRELNERANQLAHVLREHGVGPEVLVGICVERSLEMIIALLGILKAGGCCLSLDPSYPQNRLALMIEDCGAKLLLTHNRLARLLETSNVKPIFLDADWNSIIQKSAAPLQFELSSNNLAYVLYTSGSTGIPKGVAMPHRVLCNLVSWQLRNAHFKASRTLQFAPLSFDVSFQEIFATLCCGGTLFLIPEALRQDPEKLIEFLLEKSIERLFLPFVALQQLTQCCDRSRSFLNSLKHIIAAGEQLQITPSIKAWFEKLPECELENQYGPTESHVVTSFVLEGSPREWHVLPPIGRPIDNAKIYILDSNLQPVPVGVIGELFIGGAGLARGYINQSGLTAERFIINPFNSKSGDRIYKTGDLARYLSDGNIQFIGRNDEQVKIRGFRIELGEIESVLRQHVQVKKAAVRVSEDSTGDKRLIAYVVPDSSNIPSRRNLRAFLKHKLPDYMIPSFFIPMDKFPLTPTGKIDRLALPPLESAEIASEGSTHIAPRNPIEEKLKSIWQKLLGLDLISIRDNFFEIGGHSLLAIRLIGRIEEVFGKRLSLAALFQGGTIEQLAELLRSEASLPSSNIVVEIQAGNADKPLFLIHGLGGELYSWRRLLRHLKTDYAIYGLQPPEQNGGRKVYSDLEDMAQEYVNSLCAMRPNGPFSIMGYSYGGKIALEIAQQLIAKNREVDLLAIIDTGPGLHKPRSPKYCVRAFFYFAKNLPFWIYDDLIRENTESIGIRIRKKLKTTKKRISHFFNEGLSTPYKLDLEDTFEGVFLDNMPDRALNEIDFETWKKYTISCYPGRITLFRSRTRPLFHSLEPDLGWSRIALKGVDIKVIPGHHLSIMHEPNIQHLAKALQTALESR